MSRNQAHNDMDVSQYIEPGVREIHSFSDTLKWWHGTWIMTVPFWRPLTSYGFWFEYKVFGFYRFDQFFWVSVVSNLILCAALWWFTKALTKSVTVASITVLFFSGYGAISPLVWDMNFLNVFGSEGSFPPADLCLDAWKNQPDQWCDFCMLAALTLVQYEQWATAVLATAAAVAFKESGYYTYPLMVGQLYAQRRLSAAPLRAWLIASGSLLGLVYVRWLSGPAVFRGYHFGGHSGFDSGTLCRFTYSALQPYPAAFIQFPAAAILATAFFAAAMIPRMPRPLRYLVGLLGVAAALTFDVVVNQYDVLSAIYIETEWPTHLSRTLACLAWFGCVWILFKDRTDLNLKIYLIGAYFLSCFVLITAVQVQSHVLLLAYAFKCILATLVVRAAWRCAQLKLDSITTPPFIRKPMQPASD